MRSVYKSAVMLSAQKLEAVWRSACLLAVAALLSGVFVSAVAQTNISVGTTVKQSGAKRFGINLANQDFYDSGMLLRNVIFRNPGFEGYTHETILQCQTVSTTSCADGNPYATWGTNFMKGGTYTFMTGPAAGLTGTVTSQDAANYANNTGITIHFAALSATPVSGDIVQVRTAYSGDVPQIPGNTTNNSPIMPGAAQDGWFILNQGGATLSTDTVAADQAPGTTGIQCLQVTGPNNGQYVTVAQLFDTTNGRSFIQLNGTYTITFKAKSTGGSPNFNLQVVRLQSPTQITYLNQNVALTNQWQTYSYSFSSAETGSASGAVEATFNFNGNSLLLDDVQMSADKNTYGTAFRDEVVSTLIALKPGVLRYMDSAQGMGTSFDNMLKDQYGRQRAGWSTQGMEIDTVPVGLYDFLRLCQVVGAEPWWTMPTAMNQTELQHVMEYMAGPSTSTYGAIRAAQGQTAPWTTVFPTIHLELGNEVWNGGSFSGETIVSPDRFGQWANSVFSAAKATSYYTSNSSSFDFVIGSLEVNEFWTQYELDNCAACDTLAVAAYMFGNFSDYSSTEAIFGPLMAYPQWLDGPSTSNGNNHMFLQTQVAAGINVADANGTKNPAAVAIYETNLGTNSGTAPQSFVNSTVPSVGAGIATANHMLMMLRDLGVKTQNMFAISEYTNGYNGPNASFTPLWGTVIDMGVTNLKRPQFVAEELANTAILPTVLTTVQTGDNPTWNQPLSANDNVQLNNVNYIQSYAFTDGTHNNLIVMNLHRTATLAVTFSGANAPSGSIKVSQLTSANITDTNETSPKVNISYSNVANLDPTKPYSLPPYSMTVFEPGTALPVSTTTLTATPTSINFGQSVSLSAVVTSQSGTTTPTGTVTFLEGTTTLGTGTLSAGGVATFSATALVAGSHSITASYGGDSADSNSVSSPVTVTVSTTTVATTTALTASATAASTGQSITFTATVTPQSGTNIPSGTVTFSDGATNLGTGTLSGGVTTFATASLAVGTHSIKASYGGDTKDAASVSSVVTVMITQVVVASTTTLTTTATTATTGQSITFTATVTPQTGKGMPTGTATFMNGGVSLGTGNLNSSGVASLGVSNLTLGSHSITAAYNGDAKDGGSDSGIVTETITSPITAPGAIPDGVYTLINQLTKTYLDDPGSATASGVQIIEGPLTTGTDEKWSFASNGSGYYTIQNLASSLYLTSPNLSTVPGIPLVQQAGTNSDWQLWKLVASGNNFTIQNKASGLVLDYGWVPGIDLWVPNGGTNQGWSITPSTGYTGVQIVAEGDYSIANSLTAKLLDDPAGSTVQGLQIVQNPKNGLVDQRWHFAFKGNGYYTIQNLASGQYLTSPDSSTTPGMLLVQEPATNNGWQLWLLSASGRSFILQNKSSSLVIDYPWVAGIDLWTQNGGTNQMWLITK